MTSRLGVDPQRMTALARSLDRLDEQLRMHIGFDDSSTWFGSDIRRKLERCSAIVQQQGSGVRRILSSSFFDLIEQPRTFLGTDASAIDRWVDDHPSWWSDATHGQPTMIDSWATAIVDDPVAVGQLIDSTDFLAPLIYGIRDAGLLRSLWLTATNPLLVSPAVAGQRIRRLLDTVFGSQTWRHGIARSRIDVPQRNRMQDEVRAMLGEVAAPWQIHFSGLAHEWGWDPQKGIGYLEKIAESRRAALSISEGLGAALYANLSHLPNDDEIRIQKIDAVAFAVGVSTTVVRDAKISEARSQASHVSSLMSLPTKFPLKLPWPASLMIGSVTSRLAGTFDSTKQTAASSTVYMIESRELLSAIAFMAVWKSALRSGRMPQPSAPPPTAVVLELQHTVDSISNATARGQAAVEIGR